MNAVNDHKYEFSQVENLIGVSTSGSNFAVVYSDSKPTWYPPQCSDLWKEFIIRKEAS
jgi:hypothetical protein